jgi:hypothetical protein
MAAWYHLDTVRNVLCIKFYVQPNARTTEVAGLHADALKVRIAAPPLDDRANLLLIDFLGEMLRVSANRISIRRGQKGRNKVVEILAPGEEALRIIREWEH